MKKLLSVLLSVMLCMCVMMSAPWNRCFATENPDDPVPCVDASIHFISSYADYLLSPEQCVRFQKSRPNVSKKKKKSKADAGKRGNLCYFKQRAFFGCL